jgi:endonuclease YncB( thermonuclease family)
MRNALLILVVLWAGPALAEDLAGAAYVSCYDGDTCAVNVAKMPPVFGHHLPIRFAGIDAPEIKAACTKEYALAITARDFLIAQMSRATSLVLQNVTRDKYFRVDATVLADGVNLNLLMVTKGYAVLYSGIGAKHNWCL